MHRLIVPLSLVALAAAGCAHENAPPPQSAPVELAPPPAAAPAAPQVHSTSDDARSKLLYPNNLPQYRVDLAAKTGS
jgi:hypothetical protein